MEKDCVPTLNCGCNLDRRIVTTYVMKIFYFPEKKQYGISVLYKSSENTADVRFPDGRTHHDSFTYQQQ